MEILLVLGLPLLGALSLALFGARRFAAVTLCAWPLMAAMFTLGVVNIRKPEVHKRLMVLLMVGIMTPAIARVFLTFFAPPGRSGPPPAFVSNMPGATVVDAVRERLGQDPGSA